MIYIVGTKKDMAAEQKVPEGENPSNSETPGTSRAVEAAELRHLLYNIHPQGQIALLILNNLAHSRVEPCLNNQLYITQAIILII